MKKLFVLVIVLFVAGFSCKEKDKCQIDKPGNIKPIDWENYNDTHTVYWNYTGDCSDFTIGQTDHIIKMYGWIFDPQSVRPHDFYLLSDSLFVEANNPKCAMVRIQCFYKEALEAIQTKFDTSDLKRRCYVTGSLIIFDRPNNDCCFTTPTITIMNADDVYFE
ncbi:MAG: hypothetical protein FWG84_06250 [Bacteroidales bacterium]|nr:hypothetical protein [Bacteroidales bacterium]